MGKIRTAETGDLNSILHILNEAALHLRSKGINQWNYPWDSGVIEEAILRGEANVLLHEGQMAGTFFLGKISRLAGLEVEHGSLYLSKIALLPSCHGRNLGSEIIGYAVSFAKSMEKDLYLDCWAGNEKLKQFYGRNGMEFLGDFPEEDYFISVFCKKAE